MGGVKNYGVSLVPRLNRRSLMRIPLGTINEVLYANKFFVSQAQSG
jgi:hypothetical protein